jgi:hypothetical protein
MRRSTRGITLGFTLATLFLMAATATAATTTKANDTVSYGASQMTVTSGHFAVRSATSGHYYVGVDAAIKKYDAVGGILGTYATVIASASTATLNGFSMGGTDIVDNVFYFINIGLNVLVRFSVGTHTMHRIAGGGGGEADGTGVASGFAFSSTSNAISLNDDHTALYIRLPPWALLRTTRVLPASSTPSSSGAPATAPTGSRLLTARTTRPWRASPASSAATSTPWPSRPGCTSRAPRTPLPPAAPC